MKAVLFDWPATLKSLCIYCMCLSHRVQWKTELKKLKSHRTTAASVHILINKSMLAESAVMVFSFLCFSLPVLFSFSRYRFGNTPKCSPTTVPYCVNKPNVWQVAAFIWWWKSAKKWRVICLCVVFVYRVLQIDKVHRKLACLLGRSHLVYSGRIRSLSVKHLARLRVTGA